MDNGAQPRGVPSGIPGVKVLSVTDHDDVRTEWLRGGWVRFHGLIDGVTVDALTVRNDTGDWVLAGVRIEAEGELRNDGTLPGYAEVTRPMLTRVRDALGEIKGKAIPATAGLSALALGKVGRHATDAQRKDHRKTVSAIARAGIKAGKSRADVIRQVQATYTEGTGKTYTRQAVSAWLDGYGFGVGRWAK